MGTLEPPCILLADADVLIDYAQSDRSVLRLISDHLAPLKVLRQVLATVKGLTAADCKSLHVEVVTPSAELLLLAGRERSRVSVEDYLCFLVCRNEQWTCLTNDKKLQKLCGSEAVSVKRGLRPMIELVAAGHLAKRQAIQIAEMIRASNPRHIDDEILADFRAALGKG